jgi:hypothetical protein
MARFPARLGIRVVDALGTDVRTPHRDVGMGGRTQPLRLCDKVA